jgi:hypothetical protein
MARKRPSTQFHEPSLVPLADMLTNTVGIMVFILIFTVLTACGAVIAKRLPMEQSTEKDGVKVICWHNWAYPMPSGLLDQFLKPLGEPERSLGGFREYVAKFKAQVVENEHLKLTGEGEIEQIGNSTHLDLTVVVTPKDGGGETIEDLKKLDGAFGKLLKQCNSQKQFIAFLVYPDSIDVFKAARDVAVASKLETGWSPRCPNMPVRLSLTGGGRQMTPQ